MTIELTLVDIRQNVSPPSSSKQKTNNDEKEIITTLVNATIRHCGASSASAVLIPPSSPFSSLPPNSYSDFHLENGTPTGINTTTISDAGSTHQESISTSILRYVRVPDKYTSFCSVLLKSWAYHNLQQRLQSIPSRTHHHHHHHPHHHPPPPPPSKGTHSIVELPRTNEGKPYIPFQMQTTPGYGYLSNTHAHAHGHGHENAHAHPYPISISHQYPHVAIATSLPPPPPPPPPFPFSFWLGQDIVQFECHAPSRLYATQDDFLSVFQQSFTPWEWHRICFCDFDVLDGGTCTTHKSVQMPFFNFWKRQSEDGGRKPIKDFDNWNFTLPSCRSRSRCRRREGEEQLKEFYLRWSMKEAYTKALGLGMRLEFTSFETHLVGIDDCNRENVEVDCKNDCSGGGGGDVGDIHRNGNHGNEKDNDDERKRDNTVENGHERSYTNGIWEYVCQQIRYKQCHHDATLDDDCLPIKNCDNHDNTDTTNTTSDKQYCHGRSYATVQGIIKRFDTTKGTDKHRNERMERWNFYFVPLSSSCDGKVLNESTGCVCVCASECSAVTGYQSVDGGEGGSNGAVGDKTRNDSFLDLAIKFTTLDDLISFHAEGTENTLQ